MARIAPAVMALSLALSGCAAGAAGHDHAHESSTVAGAREIAVTAAALRFDPGEILVEAGEDVTIVLTAKDVAHDFVVDGAAVHVAAEPGMAGRGGLRLDAPGRYAFRCTVPGHADAGMRGTVIVG